MLIVLQIVLPVFAIVVLGFAARRTNRISVEGVRGMNDFVFLLALPALLFAGAAGSAPSRATLVIALAYFTGCVPVYALALVIGRRLRGLRLADAGLFALDASYGNLAMAGIPLTLAAYGPEGLRDLLAIIAFHSIILLPIATLVAETGLNASASPARILVATASAMLRNPIVLAVVLGGLWAALLPPPPELLLRPLQLLGAAGPAAALFCLGASLTGFDPRRGGATALVGVSLKLVVLPAAVLATARLFGLDALGTAVAVTAAGMPTGANAFILARRYATGMDRSAATVLLASALSVVTLGAIIAAFRN